MNFIITILILFIMLGLIISIHEFGHFIAAKKSGVYVDEFSLGMGPLIFKHKPKNSETTYSLRLLPIGGFVSMAEKEEKKSKVKKDRVLENKDFFHVFWVLINGIVFNFILAIVLFFISGLAYGRPINEPIISEVVVDGAAYKAGIEAGDKIVEINGAKIKNWDDFTLEALAKKLEDEYEFKVVKPNGEIKTYIVVPDVKNDNGTETRVYGIGLSATRFERGFKQAFIYAFEGTYENSITIFKILGSLFTGKVSVKNLSGPVGIYSVVDTVKSRGLQTLLYLTAYLSINVGIVNLIPIPVFDGGRVLILIIEKITRKKSSEKLELTLNYVGFALMILLMLFVTFNDVVRLIAG